MQAYLDIFVILGAWQFSIDNYELGLGPPQMGCKSMRAARLRHDLGWGSWDWGFSELQT